MENKPWFYRWFNEDYLKLYAYRSPEEAEQHVNFLVKALSLQGNEKILDLGCGMGRHTLALAKRGYNVLGIDISEFLIKQAEEELVRSQSLKAAFLVRNMYHLEDVGLFDVIINMFTSFGYYEDDKENARVFSVVKDHLKSEGKFFLDYLHPAQVRRNLVPYEERQVNDEKVIIERSIDGDRVIKTITFPNRSYEEKVKLYDRKQIETMLAANGLTVEKVWDDYSGTPWVEDGNRQLFFASK